MTTNTALGCLKLLIPLGDSSIGLHVLSGGILDGSGVSVSLWVLSCCILLDNSRVSGGVGALQLGIRVSLVAASLSATAVVGSLRVLSG